MESKTLSLTQIERDILTWWHDHNIMTQVVENRASSKPFVFYDGPPFATGLPHYGHILQMALKDAVLRYKTMQGYNVPRKIGWDTHGLPIEYQLEKELSLSGKREIEAYGIDKFVDAARGIVLRYTAEWKKTMERMGRWVDISHPYTTMDTDYIESVWWAFKTLSDKGLIYKDFRVSPYCPRCGTVVSNFEVNLGYKDHVKDPSVYVALPLTTTGPLEDAKLIFWTTTPWTIPAVTGMAVHPEAEYVVFTISDNRYVMAKDRVADLFQEVTITHELKGIELVGTRYEPAYRLSSDAQAYRIVSGDHVTVSDGTGIVSVAPAYGEIDSEVGRREQLPMVQHVQRDGSLDADNGIPGEGLFVKEADKYIIEDLDKRGYLVKEKEIAHTYPFCWRCDTPLLYFPTTSWFVKVTALRDQLIEENRKIAWQPEHLRDGRFGRWLEGSRDWAISRDRYWGAPLPVWQCESCGKETIIGDRASLNLTPTEDLHRPAIDRVTLPCVCGGVQQRIPFVFDCWFESGSMPFAQHHYPFESEEGFAPEGGQGYPADFIAEALDQTRGWFYTLHVLGVGLFGKRAFRNVVSSGLILAADGRKLSKRLQNYTDPEVIMDEQGVDALRLFLFTATTLGEDYRFSDTAVQDVKRRWIVPLLNVLQYYGLSLKEQDGTQETEPHHGVLDTWIKSRLAETQAVITQAMEGDDRHSPFDLVRACRTFGPLVEDLSTWYVRLSRGRKDGAFTKTLEEVLRSIAALYAPFLPFLTEHIYQSLGNKPKVSVHMEDYPQFENWQNSALLSEMEIIRTVVSEGRTLRTQAGIPLRQPLAELCVVLKGSHNLSSTSLSIIEQELQIDSVRLVDALPEMGTSTETSLFALALQTEISDALRARGQANMLRRVIQDLRKQSNLQAGDLADVIIEGLPDAVVPYLSRELQPYTRLNPDNRGTHMLGQAEAALEGETITILLYN